MIQYRSSIFETNSSSTHSIVIADKVPDNLPETIDFQIGEFGWERECLDTITEKASYLYTAACAIAHRDVQDAIIDLLTPFGIECVFSVEPQFKSSKYTPELQWLDNGYVDHCTETKPFVEYCFDNAFNMLAFLCSDDSFILTGNDNESEEEYGDGWWDKAENVTYPHTTFYKGN